MKTFGLLDLLGLFVATVLLVATMMALPLGWTRAACLAGGVVGAAGGWAGARRRSWEFKVLLIPFGTLAGMAVALGWTLW